MMKELLIAQRIMLTLVCTLIMSSSATAQIYNIKELLRVSKSDAELIMMEYIRPYVEGSGAAANTGWIHSAETHSVFGFHLNVRVGTAMVPSHLNSFDLHDLPLTNLRPVNPNISVSPTISGSGQAGPEVELIEVNGATNQEEQVTRFELPGGFGIPYAVAPVVQAGVGLPYRTDLMIRLLPGIHISDYGRLSAYGMGINHELTQWMLPRLPFTLSFQAAMMTMNLDHELSIELTRADFEDLPDFVFSRQHWSNEQALFSSRSWNANLVAGRSFGLLSVFVGLGVHTTSATLDFTTEHPSYQLSVDREGNRQIEISTVNRSLLTVDMNTSILPRTFAGGTLNFGVLYLVADITYADYVVVNTGLGYSFR